MKVTLLHNVNDGRFRIFSATVEYICFDGVIFIFKTICLSAKLSWSFEPTKRTLYIYITVSSIEPATLPNLGECVTGIRHHATDLIEKNDARACWALLDRLFPRQFFYRLGLTVPYSGGKGKPKRGYKRPYQGVHPPRPLQFSSEHLSPEKKEQFCKLQEERQRQEVLAKEAAAKAAAVEEQSRVLMQLARIHQRETEIEKEKEQLAQKYLQHLKPTGSGIAVNVVTTTPPVTPQKSMVERARESLQAAFARVEEARKRKEEKDEEALLKEVHDMEIEPVQ